MIYTELFSWFTCLTDYYFPLICFMIFMKGHLLVLKNFNSLPLNHGLMEAGYVDHKHASTDHERMLSVSMTATVDAMGNLLLGKFLLYGDVIVPNQELRLVYKAISYLMIACSMLTVMAPCYYLLNELNFFFLEKDFLKSR